VVEKAEKRRSDMGFTNQFQFQKDLERFTKEEIPVEFKRRQIEIIIYLFNRIRWHTPIAPNDSQWKGFKGGFAITNWRVTMNLPPSNTVGEYGKPTRMRTTEEIRGQFDTMKQGSGSSQGIFDYLWIFNNVHYIQALENGHSKQFPRERMVAMSIDETVTYFQTKGWMG
jgi:hypothetical protein